MLHIRNIKKNLRKLARNRVLYVRPISGSTKPASYKQQARVGPAHMHAPGYKLQAACRPQAAGSKLQAFKPQATGRKATSYRLGWVGPAHKRVHRGPFIKFYARRIEGLRQGLNPDKSILWM